jgi:hypothetical protein
VGPRFYFCLTPEKGLDVATILEVRGSDGSVRRCDERCYSASQEDCDCVCGGVNHGVGQKRAIEFSRELTDEDILKDLDAHGPDRQLFVIRRGFQMELPFTQG